MRYARWLKKLHNRYTAWSGPTGLDLWGPQTDPEFQIHDPLCHCNGCLRLMAFRSAANILGRAQIWDAQDDPHKPNFFLLDQADIEITDWRDFRRDNP